MRYLIITENDEPFYTGNFDYRTQYKIGSETTVFDLVRQMHSYDGKNWQATNTETL